MSEYGGQVCSSFWRECDDVKSYQKMEMTEEKK
jgi:hypothetical protein